MVGWIASFGCFSLITRPCCPAKSKPMLTAFTEAVAADTDAILASIAAATVVVQLVLNVTLVAALACNVGLVIENGRY